MNHPNASQNPSTYISLTSLRVFTLFCLLIYFFNCTDLLFTYTYLKTGYFYEFNPIMRPIVSSPWLSIIVKIIMPAILLAFVLLRLPQTVPKLLNVGIAFSGLITLFYLFINCMHIYYLFNIL